MAAATEFPLCHPTRRDQKDPTVTRALQSGDPRLGWHVAQLLVAQRKRLPHGAIDAQLVRCELQPRCREMTADVEQLSPSQGRINLIEGRLQVGWPLLSNDQAHRSGFRRP